MAGRTEVIVIGGSQAGLAASHELRRLGVEHVVLERGRVAQAWRGRWDSFCLVTPNWSVRLPGLDYDGDDPDGYLPRDDVVRHLERYAAHVDAPLREGVEVTALEPAARERFVLRTSEGDVAARAVVVATGTYGRPHLPPAAASFPDGVERLTVEEYRSPAALGPGGVLVIGSGQSGCQIAEELLAAGREVFVACGRAPWAPRRFGDRDTFWWAAETGFLYQPVTALPVPQARLWANVLGTGARGGHDLHLRTLRAAGATLLGHFDRVEGGRVHFADDLADSVAWGDDRYRQLCDLIRALATVRGLPMPDLPDPDPFDGRAPTSVDLATLGAVVFAGGFRPDYASWIRVPGAFDDLGFPLQVDGASTVAAGLYFVGVHFQRTRKSSLLFGVGEDAAIVADAVARGRA